MRREVVQHAQAGGARKLLGTGRGGELARHGAATVPWTKPCFRRCRGDLLAIVADSFRLLKVFQSFFIVDNSIMVHYSSMTCTN